MADQQHSISPACKRSILLMSRMSRAYSRENPQQFQKACATFATHLSKSNEDVDEEYDDVNTSTNFPQAYTKKIAGSLS